MSQSPQLDENENQDKENGCCLSKGRAYLPPMINLGGKLSKRIPFLPSFHSPRSPPPIKREGVVHRVKAVVVGDSGVGKTSLLGGYLFNEQCGGLHGYGHTQTVRDDFTYCTTQSGVGDVDLDLIDTGGHTELDRLRPLCYGNTDVAIICFSLVTPSSFSNVTKRWVPELKRHCVNKNLKTVLVGTQSDLRSNVTILLHLMEDGLAPISEARGVRLAKKIGAVKYLECSSFSGYNVKKIFETVITSGVKMTITPTLPLKAVSTSVGKPKKNSKTTTLRISSNNAASDTTSVDPKLLKRWRVKQKSNKIKRLIFSCLH